MPIPRKKINVDLTKSTPTELTVEVLQKQLNNLGLSCAHTDPARLAKYKEEIEKQFYDGLNQSFGILKPIASTDGSPYYKSMYGNPDAPLIGLEGSSVPDWQPSGNALGYATKLSTIVFPRNFQFLIDNKTGFGGNRSGDRTETHKYDTVEAIKQLFIQVGIESSASLVKGLDKTTLNSVLANAIAPINEGNVKDYDVTDSRVIYLVDNYNPITQEAEAIGVLGIDWHLRIVDYLEKKKNPQHDTTLTVSTRSVLYDSVAALEADYQFVTSHKGKEIFGIPPIKKKLKIFDQLPPANQDSFDQGLPLIAKDDFVDVLILYAPDLESVGSMDNTDSDIVSTYSKSVTSGFTFSMGQSLTVGAEFEAGVVFAKGKVSVELNVSFTETWNNSQTETIEFSCPGRKQAFTYQGYLLSRKLRFFPETQTFAYVESEGRFLTNILKTSDTPIIGKTSNIVNV